MYFSAQIFLGLSRNQISVKLLTLIYYITVEFLDTYMSKYTIIDHKI